MECGVRSDAGHRARTVHHRMRHDGVADGRAEPARRHTTSRCSITFAWRIDSDTASVSVPYAERPRRCDVPTETKHTMNTLLWVLQILTALLYGASGVMKIFMFDKISADVPSFGALSRNTWAALGVVELVCVVGLIVPSALRWHPTLTVVAATVLALESLVFIGVHLKYRETGTLVMCVVLGLLMAFIAYGRAVLQPLA